MKVSLDAIVWDPSVYPRKGGPDAHRVARYAACMRDGEAFDPIQVEPPKEGKYRLLDGAHRLEALRETGATEAEVLVVSPDGLSPLLYAARANRHGKDLTDSDAEDVARRAFQQNPRISNKAIAQAIGRSEAAVSSYLADLRAHHEMAQDIKIFKMALLGIPQDRIATRLGIAQPTIAGHLSENSTLKNPINALLERGFSVNAISQQLGWPEPLVWAVALEGKGDRDRFEALGWNIRPWDYWYWAAPDERFGDPWQGRIPGQLVAQALYFLTKPGDLVLDPMAGGGVTPDVCLALGRRCWSFEKEDRPERRPEIEPYLWVPGNLAWPVSSRHKPDLILFDPPYYKKQEEAYGRDSISALPRSEYLRFFRDWAALAKQHSKPSTRLALLMADWRAFDSTALLDEDPSEAITLLDYVREVGASWEFTHRIEAPLPSERFTGNMVTAMQERRSLGTVLRTVLLFRQKP